MVSQLISRKRSTDFSLRRKGGEKTGLLLQERLHLTMKRPEARGKVWLSGVCKGGNLGECRQYLRIVRALQYPVPSVPSS